VSCSVGQTPPPCGCFLGKGSSIKSTLIITTACDRTTASCHALVNSAFADRDRSAWRPHVSTSTTSAADADPAFLRAASMYCTSFFTQPLWMIGRYMSARQDGGRQPAHRSADGSRLADGRHRRCAALGPQGDVPTDVAPSRPFRGPDRCSPAAEVGQTPMATRDYRSTESHAGGGVTPVQKSNTCLLSTSVARPWKH